MKQIPHTPAELAQWLKTYARTATPPAEARYCRDAAASLEKAAERQAAGKPLTDGQALVLGDMRAIVPELILEAD